MKPLVRVSVVLAVALLAAAVLCVSAAALPAPAGTQAGRPVNAAATARHATAGSSCGVGLPLIGEAVSGVTNGLCEAGGLVGEAAGAVGGLIGEAAGSAVGSVLDSVSEWMIAAATQVTGFVAREMTHTTTPQLSSAWFAAQFAPMADLGAALGLLVALIALASAAVRRSPDALAGTLSGIVRAGLGTGLVVALTAIGLAVADEISNAVLSSSPHAFWTTVEHSWSAHGFGGFGSSALAMLIALVEVFASLFVWLELIVRGAAIYLAVLFFPVVLAAAIWPALASWPGRLGRLLLLFVVLKPVAIIVLAFAGNAAAAGLSFGAGGVPGSVGTILAATVILGLAAFAPWTLMYLLAMDAEGAYTSAGIRASAGQATTSEHGRSVRNIGGLSANDSQGQAGATGGKAAGGSATLTSGGHGGDPSSGGGGGSGPDGGTPDGSGGGGAGPGGASPPGGPSPMGEGSSTAPGGADGTLPVGAQNIGAGSIGAAAGMITAGVVSGGESGASTTDGQSGSPSSNASGGTSGAQSLRLAAQSSPETRASSPSPAKTPSTGPSSSEQSASHPGGGGGDEPAAHRRQSHLRLVRDIDREPTGEGSGE